MCNHERQDLISGFNNHIINKHVVTVIRSVINKGYLHLCAQRPYLAVDENQWTQSAVTPHMLKQYGLRQYCISFHETKIFKRSTPNLVILALIQNSDEIFLI